MHLEFLRKLLGQHLQVSPANQTRPRLQVATPARGAAGTGLGQVSPNQYPANLGVPYTELPQGNLYNPGLIPMQGSLGQRAYPQIGAYGGVQRPGDQVNPQDRYNQQYWLQ